ncbi:MAG TPA: pyridoxamine 5'-phosphate oxidase family protein [Jiangellaceae bacterium]|nr:pyridoxamine 5'-phosphate oxidase family protein [Jiangellaceae bacterium]
MASTDPVGTVDARFGEEGAGPTPWPDVRTALTGAELFWLSTVRVDGRPHVTPLIAVLVDDRLHFCTGVGEQKARNLEHDNRCTMTTGNNAWAQGLDIVTDGVAVRVTEQARLQQIADTFEAKYGSDWHFDVKDGAFDGGGGPAFVFEVRPSTVFAFAKDPHSQTRFDFDA